MHKKHFANAIWSRAQDLSGGTSDVAHLKTSIDDMPTIATYPHIADVIVV